MPSKTPIEIVEKLSKEINATLVDPKIRARLADLGGTAFPNSPAEFRQFIAAETERWAQVVATVLGWQVTAGAEDAPKGNVGYTTTKTVSIDLGPEIPAMAGWELRLRVLNIQPGGHIGIHNHKDRPATVYFLQGTDTVTNEDGTSKTFHPGDTTAEGVKTVHWHRNVGNDAVILVTGDLVKTAK